MQALWVLFCRTASRIFYRQIEVVGVENFPDEGAAMLCANHANSLADVGILQSSIARVLHPLARSGLFKKPFLRVVLWFIQAVPIYRAHDPGSNTQQNTGSFDRCYELLTDGEALILFPEGISHSKPMMQPIKTGAARIALGSFLRGGPLPKLVPAGLTFVEKGKFRGRVLVQIGEPVALDDIASSITDQERAACLEENVDAPRASVREATDRLEAALHELTLNADSWHDLQLMRNLERFFHFRDGRRPSSSPLATRFRTFKRLQEAQEQLRELAPKRLDALRRKLLWFERLQKVYGIDDYHLGVHVAKGTFLRAAIFGFLVVLLLSPIALWGFLTSGPPYLLVRYLTPRVAAGSDQFDTSKTLLGMNLFGLFWGGIVALTYWYTTVKLTAAVAISLPIAGALAMTLLSQRKKIHENLSAYFLFRNKKDLRQYLLQRRNDIEQDLADLTRLVR